MGARRARENRHHGWMLRKMNVEQVAAAKVCKKKYGGEIIPCRGLDLH
jgi:hypothetical protein